MEQSSRSPVRCEAPLPGPLPRRAEDPRLAFPDSERTITSVRETDASGRPLSGRPLSPGSASPGKGKIAAVVALSLLEVIRARDLPTEILESEDPSQTMPRRLGLSGVVDVQIRRLREQARRRERITVEQARDLVHLILRRPDSEEVFFQAGELLAGKVEPLGGDQPPLSPKGPLLPGSTAGPEADQGSLLPPGGRVRPRTLCVGGKGALPPGHGSRRGRLPPPVGAGPDHPPAVPPPGRVGVPSVLPGSQA
jgi:hypothetical protein